MIHEAKCDITISASPGIFLQPVKIPSDAEIEELFPNWKSRVGAFIGLCAQEEGKSPFTLSGDDIFRYGMKFMICESKSLL